TTPRVMRLLIVTSISPACVQRHDGTASLENPGIQSSYRTTTIVVRSSSRIRGRRCALTPPRRLAGHQVFAGDRAGVAPNDAWKRVLDYACRRDPPSAD